MRGIGPVAMIAIVVLGGMSLGGCESVEQETGLSKQVQAAGVGGAAAGALVAATVVGATGASPAWIAAGVAGGALLGAGVASMTEDDSERHAVSRYQAVLSQPPGGQTSWHNPATGNHGTLTITDQFRRSDGTLCKRFDDDMTLDGKEHFAQGTGCEQEDGRWQVVSIAPREPASAAPGK